MARVSPAALTDLQSDSLLPFPQKLWSIVNNPKCEEIHWNTPGTGIVIPSTRRFISEILNSPSSAPFKTKNFSSFIRQLNLYGFRKVSENAKRTAYSPLSLSSKCEFKHPNFRKERRDLLVHVKRQLFSTKKPGKRKQKTCTPPPSGKQFDKLPGSPSITVPWSPALYTPIPLVSWQTSLQMPFAMYAPFCNTYQLAQIQQGSSGGASNLQGLGLPGQFQQSATSPSTMWTQSLESCKGNVSYISSSVSVGDKMSAGVVSTQDSMIAVERDAGGPIDMKHTIYEDSSELSRGVTHSSNTESRELSISGSQPFMTHPLNREAAVHNTSDSHSFEMEGNGESCCNEERNVQEFKDSDKYNGFVLNKV